MRSIALTFFLLYSIIATAQEVISSDSQDTYKIGVMSYKDTIMKLPGEIRIMDSTVTFKFNGKETTKRITSKNDNIIYITDGHTTDRITISPMVATIKGFKFNFTIVVDPDTRFNPIQVIYYGLRPSSH